MPLTPKSRHHKKNGFTLIELIITTIIMGFAAIIIIPYLTAVTHSPDPVLREKAIGLGQAMMDEILAKRWDENSPNGGGPIVTGETATGTRGTVITTPNATAPAALGSEAGETRATFDDIDDYNTLSEPDGGGFFYDQNGAFLPGSWTGFQRIVNVTYIASNEVNIDSSTTTSGATSTDTKRIIVTVTSPLGETFQLVAVTCNF